MTMLSETMLPDCPRCGAHWNPVVDVAQAFGPVVLSALVCASCGAAFSRSADGSIRPIQPEDLSRYEDDTVREICAAIIYGRARDHYSTGFVKVRTGEPPEPRRGGVVCPGCHAEIRLAPSEPPVPEVGWYVTTCPRCILPYTVHPGDPCMRLLKCHELLKLDPAKVRALCAGLLAALFNEKETTNA